jgi:hypothetical protein
MRLVQSFFVLSLALLLAPQAQAQELTFSGQVRPRYESRDPVAGDRDASTSMRVRAAIQAAIEPGLTVFIQAQDVRLWGSETNTLGDFAADNFDIHQAYIRYTGAGSDWLTTTIGRQETAFGGQRLVGAVGWAQQGRSFDGVRFDAGKDATKVSFIAYTLADASAPAHATDAELFGAYATFGEMGPGALDVYWLFDRVEGDDVTNESTLGARYAFNRGTLSGRVEGSLQRGERGGDDVSAYMVGARLGSTFSEGKASLTAWYDYLSGDADAADGEAGTFNTLYATNHKFYGFADLFLNIPAHTGGLGLVDAALKLSVKPSSTVTLGADYHMFSAAAQGSLSTRRFADELDLTLSHRYSPNLGVTTGASFVFQKDGLGEIGRLGENMTWLYVMFDAIF